MLHRTTPGKLTYSLLTGLIFITAVVLLFPPPATAQGNNNCPINPFLGGSELHTEGAPGDMVYIVCVDLTDPYLRFQTVMANDVLNVNAHPDQRETVTSMAERQPYSVHRPIIAFNADYFGAGHGAEGLTVIDGSRIDGPGSPSYDKDNNEVNRISLSISRLNAVEISHKRATEVEKKEDNIILLSRFYNSVGGGPILVRGGEIIPQPCLVPEEHVSRCNCTYLNDDGSCNCACLGRSSPCTCRNPAQTAVGVSQDGRTLIIVVAESKSGEEVGEILQRYGAYRAMKFDGGGSSQLWFEGDLTFHAEGNQGRRVADAILIFREDIPRHDSLIIAQSEFPIVEPGETVDLSFTLRNRGYLTWERELPYNVRFVDGDRLDLHQFYPLDVDVPPDGDMPWSRSIVAPQQPGAYTTIWQMTYEDSAGNVEKIGPEIGFIVTVLPEGSLPNLGDAIRQLIEEAQREAEETLEEFLSRIEEEIERRIDEELSKITICGQPVFGIIFLALVLSMRKRKNS